MRSVIVLMAIGLTCHANSLSVFPALIAEENLELSEKMKRELAEEKAALEAHEKKYLTNKVTKAEFLKVMKKVKTIDAEKKFFQYFYTNTALVFQPLDFNKNALDRTKKDWGEKTKFIKFYMFDDEIVYKLLDNENMAYLFYGKK